MKQAKQVLEEIMTDMAAKKSPSLALKDERQFFGPDT